jgi:hypothetical protein
VERLEGQYPMFNDANWIGDPVKISNSINFDADALSKEFQPFAIGRD